MHEAKLSDALNDVYSYSYDSVKRTFAIFVVWSSDSRTTYTYEVFGVLIMCTFVKLLSVPNV